MKTLFSRTGLLATWSAYFLSIFRIIVGFLLIQHGAQKLFAFPAPRATTTELFSLTGLAGILEFFGGALIILGLFTRPAAFVLSGLMAVAYFMVHAPRGFWPLLNGGELAVFYSFAFLYLTAAGGGMWSLDDALWHRKRSTNVAYAK